MSYDDRKALANYVWQHESRYIHETEKKFESYLLDMFYGYGSNHVPETAYAVLKNLWDMYRNLVCDRILKEHPELSVARCVTCKAVLLTPTAQQCFICGSDWH